MVSIGTRIVVSPTFYVYWLLRLLAAARSVKYMDQKGEPLSVL